MSENSSNGAASDYAIGAGAYYGLKGIFSFYPAFVIAFYVYDKLKTGGRELLTCGIWMAIVFFACAFFIILLMGLAMTYKRIMSWLVLIFIYLWTLPGFIQIIVWINKDPVYVESVRGYGVERVEIPFNGPNLSWPWEYFVLPLFEKEAIMGFWLHPRLLILYLFFIIAAILINKENKENKK